MKPYTFFNYQEFPIGLQNGAICFVRGVLYGFFNDRWFKLDKENAYTFDQVKEAIEIWMHSDIDKEAWDALKEILDDKYSDL